MICWGGGSKTIFFVWQIGFILWSIFGINKFVDPTCQVNPYVLPLCLLKKVVVSWCLGALLLKYAPSCAHFLCVQKYLFAKSGKCLYGFPCLGSVDAWRVGGWRVLRLLVWPLPPVWLLYTCISSYCICCILVSSCDRILDTASVATFDTGVGWMVGTMTGPEFGNGV